MDREEARALVQSTRDAWNDQDAERVAGLYQELKHLPNVHRVGDAVAPRRVTDAIFEGNKLARAL